jgi:catechol 2,3-dioxygenase-like lactoylglutathione lyase family enzyme
MTTSHARKTTVGALLAGCIILATAGLILTPTRAAAQPPAARGEKAAGKRLNHIDLVVADVAENRAFCEKHFGFKCLIEFPDKLAVLTDGTDFSLVLSSPEVASEIDRLQRNGQAGPTDKRPAGADARKPIEYPAGFHIGFHQDSKDAVDEMCKKLKAAGVAVEAPQDYHGAWTFYVKAPGAYYVEVFHQSRRGDGR